MFNHTSTVVIRFKNGVKSTTNSKLLRKVVSFELHSHVYADKLHVLKLPAFNTHTCFESCTQRVIGCADDYE